MEIFSPSSLINPATEVQEFLAAAAAVVNPAAIADPAAPPAAAKPAAVFAASHSAVAAL